MFFASFFDRAPVLSYPPAHSDRMATAITFPVPLNPLTPLHPLTPLTLSSRRHRPESDVQRSERQLSVRRHPSARVPVNALAPAPAAVVISCSDCSRQNSTACVDCVVTFVCGSFVNLGPDEARALALFQSVGLVPPSQHAPAPQHAPAFSVA